MTGVSMHAACSHHLPGFSRAHLLVLFVGQLLCYDRDARCKPTVTPLQVWEKREREGASGRDCILPVVFMGLSIPAKQKEVGGHTGDRNGPSRDVNTGVGSVVMNSQTESNASGIFYLNHQR